jgi:hypothetical protein
MLPVSSIHAATDYMMRTAMLTVEQLLLILVPLLLFALIFQQLARFIRNRVAWTLKFDAYTYLTAPGVAIHELGHAFFCIIFRHKIVKMKLFSPQNDGTLGYVQHSYNPKSTYQKFGNFFIGTGPIWFGTLVVYLIARYILLAKSTGHAASSASVASVAGSPNELAAVIPAVANRAWTFLIALFQSVGTWGWESIVAVYLVFCIGSHITLSRPDVQGAAKGFFLFVAAVLVFNLITLWTGERFASQSQTALAAYLGILYGACLLILGVNVCLAVVIGLLYRLTRLIISR